MILGSCSLSGMHAVPLLQTDKAYLECIYGSTAAAVGLHIETK